MRKTRFYGPLLSIAVSLATLWTNTSLANTIPNHAMTLYQAGLKLKKSNPTQAIKDFQRAAALAPSWEPPLYEEGALFATTNFPAAIPVLLKAAKANPKDDTVWNILGWGYYQQKDYAAAEKSFYTQLSIAPNSVSAQWGLANCYANSNVRQFAKARWYLIKLQNAPLVRTLASKLLANLPPDAADATVAPNSPITYEDAVAVALSYRSDVLHNSYPANFPANAVDPDVLPYLSFAQNRGLFTGLPTPSFKASATRLFLALFLARLYGLNQYDYIRPFPLTDMSGVSVDDTMTVDSVLATRLMTTVSTDQFAPTNTMTRGQFSAIIANANIIMARPQNPGTWLTPPAPQTTNAPFVYFFATSTPDISTQQTEITDHKSSISAIGFTYYPFIADFPQGAASNREKIDHTEYLLTAMSASPDVQAELSLAETSGIKPFLVLSNYNNIADKADPAIVHQMLQDPQTRTNLIAEIVRIVQDEHLGGVTSDFENMEAADRQAYVSFIEELHIALSAIGAKTMVSLPEREQSTHGASAYDYANLGKNADLVMLITYDEHIPSSAPGSITTLFNDDRVIKYALAQIPPQKILLGVADYGYDWSNGTGVEVSMSQGDALAQAGHAQVEMDSRSQNPTFSYTDSSNTKHVVWYENEQSIKEIAALVNQYGLRGIAVWHLGSENGGFWQALQSTFRQY